MRSPAFSPGAAAFSTSVAAGGGPSGRCSGCRLLQKPLCALAGSKQFFDPLAQGRISGTSLVQVGRALTGRQLPGSAKDSQFPLEGFFHGLDSIFYHTMRKTGLKGAITLVGPRKWTRF